MRDKRFKLTKVGMDIFIWAQIHQNKNKTKNWNRQGDITHYKREERKAHVFTERRLNVDIIARE